jgi:hypothetical protein
MRCSYCYGSGHNKMGCPKAMKKAATVLPQWKAWQKMDHEIESHRKCLWRAKRHFDWEYSQYEAMEIWQAKQKRSKKEKTCNFCGESGHNKRTCPELKKTRQMLHEAELGFRASVVAGLKKTGQGIGAVVSGKREYWDRQNSKWRNEMAIGLVVGHEWDRLQLLEKRHLGELFTHETVSSPFLKVRWSNGDTELLHSIGAIQLNERPLFYRNYQVEDLTIASKSDKLQIPKLYLSPPFDGEILKGRKARRADHFRWVVNDKLKGLVEIGQKMSSTS